VSLCAKFRNVYSLRGRRLFRLHHLREQRVEHTLDSLHATAPRLLCCLDVRSHLKHDKGLCGVDSSACCEGGATSLGPHTAPRPPAWLHQQPPPCQERTHQLLEQPHALPPTSTRTLKCICTNKANGLPRYRVPHPRSHHQRLYSPPLPPDNHSQRGFSRNAPPPPRGRQGIPPTSPTFSMDSSVGASRPFLGRVRGALPTVWTPLARPGVAGPDPALPAPAVGPGPPSSVPLGALVASAVAASSELASAHMTRGVR
jgi:hypothetical protein